LAYAMIGVPFALLLLGFPVFVTLLVSSAIALYLFFPVPAVALHQVMFGSLDSFALLAIPFFIFAGEIMGRGGISFRLVNWTGALLGRTKASLPLTSVGTCTVFGSISGSAPATVAAVGRITFQPMINAGYDRRLATGVLTASGLIGNIIPPSVAMILYAAAAEQSVVRLFTAGIVPGLLLAVAFAAYLLIRPRGSENDTAEPFEWRRLLTATRQSIWALGMPVVILGGIYSGVFSPTEAAGVSIVYAIIVSMLVHRDVSVGQLLQIARHSTYITAQLMIIVAAAGVYSWLLTTSGVAPAITAYFGALDLPPWLILLIVNVLLLIIGCFIDTASAILLLTPLLAPMMVASGVDLVHFGIVMTLNLSIGMFTPPFGVNIFVAQAVFKQPLGVIYRGVIPFLLISLGVLLAVTYVPTLSLWLTQFLG
jgi:C4-dicarboxylate transporter, DctM subunit